MTQPRNLFNKSDNTATKIGQAVGITVVVIGLLLMAVILIGFLTWVAVWVWSQV